MKIDRRKFMRLSGLTALGWVTMRPGELLAQATPAGVMGAEPRVGERWAMIVDVRKCMAAKDCTDCAVACHRVHNVPDFGNPKDEIKWIWKESFHHAFEEQHHEYLEHELEHAPALVLCNHCDNPPCVRVCPTQATWKRDADGIVMMDPHRCIGCRYCVVACPYGARSFNWRDPRPFIEKIDPDFPTRTRGVVEKCTFCVERLARGLGPACVETCKEKALAFGDLEDPNSEVRKLVAEHFTIRRKPGLGTQPQVYYIV